jgi:hypothetical protein
MRRFLFLFLSLLAVTVAGCAGAEYKDNAAAVARDPRCMDKPTTPGQAPAPWCKQEAGTSWTSGKGAKVDFSGKSD